MSNKSMTVRLKTEKKSTLMTEKSKMAMKSKLTTKKPRMAMKSKPMMVSSAHSNNTIMNTSSKESTL